MHKVFLSYSRARAAAAQDIVADLQSLGHVVWFDQELSGGQPWWDRILSAIRDCDLLVFTLDLSSLNSLACSREYGYAFSLGKPVLPLLLEDGVSTNLLPPELSRIHFVDYRIQDRTSIIRLSRALSSLPPSPPLPVPMPIPPEVPESYFGSLARQIATAPSLSYEEQSGMLIKLKASLRDAATHSDAMSLLASLRSRRDLLAVIAVEIDGLMAGASAPSSPPPHPPFERQPEPEPQPQQEHQSDAAQLFALGEDYYYGRNGQKRDEARAFDLYRQAAAEGSAPAKARMRWIAVFSPIRLKNLRNNPRNVILLIAAILLSVVVVVSLIPQDVLVPNVVGERIESAEKIISDKKLEPKSVMREADDPARAGMVVEQTPSAGRRVPQHSQVQLSVGIVRKIATPNLVGSHVKDALATLAKSGLRRGSISTRIDNSPMSTVLEQLPKPDSYVSRGQTVDMVVSAGPTPNPDQSATSSSAAHEAFLSDFTRQKMAAARSMVRQQGPTLGSAVTFEKVLWGTSYYVIVVRDDCDHTTIRNTLVTVPTDELVVLPLDRKDCYRVARGLYASEVEARAARDRLLPLDKSIDGRVVAVGKGAN